jgi:hypothetical protein
MVLAPATSLGHGNESHSMKSQEHMPASKSEDQGGQTHLSKTYLEINRKYLATIKAILFKSCANCHSSKTKYPWYYSVPGVKQFIDKDVSEAKKHLDLSSDFPFKGHGSPSSDLEAIKESVSNRTMPPWSYRLMHPESELGPKAESEIVNWVDESLILLGKVSDRKSENVKK